jgi:uncharacterized SAM-dependent methyltransferase
MNPQTWNAMVERGVTNKTALQLDFAYAAPGEEEAHQLSTFLLSETDYTVRVASAQEGALSSTVWFVEGNTNETELSLEILNDWVRWMVLAGAENGHCEFDGWGAQLPR